MNKSPSLASPQDSGAGVRVEGKRTRAAVGQLASRIPDLRRNPKSWMLFRFLLGAAGAGLVVLPVGLANNYFYAVAGLVMFIAAILLPPAEPAASVEDKAREWGALVVVDGGRLVSAGLPSAAVRLFVGTERIRAADGRLCIVLDVPVNELDSVFAEELGGHWFLSIAWGERAAQFAYRGMSAEHHAHVAETALRSSMAQPLPATPRRRAAGA